jgi:hypothetical protein
MRAGTRDRLNTGALRYGSAVKFKGGSGGSIRYRKLGGPASPPSGSPVSGGGSYGGSFQSLQPNTAYSDIADSLTPVSTGYAMMGSSFVVSCFASELWSG